MEGQALSSPETNSERTPGRKRRVSQTYWAQEQEKFGDRSQVPLVERLAAMRKYGAFSLAYSTAVQPRLEHYGNADGYLAYRRRYRQTIVLGDPVSKAPERLIDSFIQQYPGMTFCQVSESTAKILESRGFYVNQMGVDTTIQLADYTLAGKEKEWLRYAYNWIAKRGYEIFESDFPEISPEQVEEISESWRKTRTVKRKEVRFLNRPIVMNPEEGVRRFFLRSPEGKLLAFVFLDPLFRDGEIIGYVTAFKRRHPETPPNGEQAIMKFIIETLKSEGVEELKLGLSPFAWIDDRDFRYNGLTSFLMRKAFTAGWINRWFYNLTGHAEYKRRFRATEEQTYFASPSRFNTLRMAAIISLCGVA